MRADAWLKAAAAIGVGAVCLAGCSAGHVSPASSPSEASAPPTSAPPPPTTSAEPPSTLSPPTTSYQASRPEPLPDRAALALIQAWAAGNRAQALQDATPAAVDTLFAIAYPAGYLQPRGCTAPSVSPGTCTYRNTDTNGIYEIEVVRAPAGWYVSSVTPES